MSSRANIPARRPVSTISPATAFCNSLRRATVVKSAAGPPRSGFPPAPAAPALPPADPAASGAAWRATRQRHRHRAGPGTRPPTAAPSRRRSRGKLLALLNAVLQHAHTPRCQGNTGPSAGGDGLRLGGFHRDKDQSKGRLSPSGRCAPGRAPRSHPRQCAAPAPNARYARRPSAPSPSQTGRRQSWCRWRRDQLAQP